MTLLARARMLVFMNTTTKQIGAALAYLAAVAMGRDLLAHNAAMVMCGMKPRRFSRRGGVTGMALLNDGGFAGRVR